MTYQIIFIFLAFLNFQTGRSDENFILKNSLNPNNVLEDFESCPKSYCSTLETYKVNDRILTGPSHLYLDQLIAEFPSKKGWRVLWNAFTSAQISGIIAFFIFYLITLILSIFYTASFVQKKIFTPAFTNKYQDHTSFLKTDEFKSYTFIINAILFIILLIFFQLFSSTDLYMTNIEAAQSSDSMVCSAKHAANSILIDSTHMYCPHNSERFDDFMSLNEIQKELDQFPGDDLQEIDRSIENYVETIKKSTSLLKRKFDELVDLVQNANTKMMGYSLVFPLYLAFSIQFEFPANILNQLDSVDLDSYKINNQEVQTLLNEVNNLKSTLRSTKNQLINTLVGIVSKATQYSRVLNAVTMENYIEIILGVVLLLLFMMVLFSIVKTQMKNNNPKKTHITFLSTIRYCYGFASILFILYMVAIITADAIVKDTCTFVQNDLLQNGQWSKLNTLRSAQITWSDENYKIVNQCIMEKQTLYQIFKDMSNFQNILKKKEEFQTKMASVLKKQNATLSTTFNKMSDASLYFPSFATVVLKLKRPSNLIIPGDSIKWLEYTGLQLEDVVINCNYPIFISFLVCNGESTITIYGLKSLQKEFDIATKSKKYCLTPQLCQLYPTRTLVTETMDAETLMGDNGATDWGRFFTFMVQSVAEFRNIKLFECKGKPCGFDEYIIAKDSVINKSMQDMTSILDEQMSSLKVNLQDLHNNVNQFFKHTDQTLRFLYNKDQCAFIRKAIDTLVQQTCQEGRSILSHFKKNRFISSVFAYIAMIGILILWQTLALKRKLHDYIFFYTESEMAG